MSNNIFLDAAIEYASRGMAVFPVEPNGKAPVTKHGVHEATTDFNIIKKWWRKYPNANIGIACGQVSGGLLVVDLDEKPNGISGGDTLRKWERENGDLPETVRAITGSGGYHIYYRVGSKEKNRVNILEGIDIRSDGGYVVAPPSIHSTGNQYQWEFDPEEYDIADADETVMKLLRTGEKSDMEAFSMKGKVGSGKRNDTIYKLACALQAKGVEDEAIMISCQATNMKQCSPPLKESEVVKLVESALKHEKGVVKINRDTDSVELLYVTDKGGKTKVRQCAENVARVLLGDPLLANKIKDDTFGHRLIYLGQLEWRTRGDTMGEWTDKDDSALRAYLDIRYGLRNKTDYEDGFNMAMLENSYNPLVGYLEVLEWDGKPHIDNLLTDYLGADPSEYNITVMRTFLQGAVHRAYHPGCKFDLMPVLIGEQGDGKTTFFKYLACNDDWFNDNFNFKNLDSKAVVEAMSGRWILEMGEMDTLKKDSVTADALKAFITSQSDTYRTPFNRRPESRKRQCVFCGTSNDVNFLKDRTGNRRYLPIDCHKSKARKDIFNEKEARPEFIQAIAEAVHIYKQDPDRPPVLPRHIEQDARQAQKDHLEEDSWVSLIEDYLETTSRDRVNALCIWDEGFKQDPVLQRRADINRILTIMRHDIKCWHEIGKARIPGYGNNAVCFEREKIPEDSGFTPIEDTLEIPF